jgi:hypothetical protein
MTRILQQGEPPRCALPFWVSALAGVGTGTILYWLAKALCL